MSLQAALDELRGYANDVRNASHRNFDNALQRYLARLENPPLDSLVAEAVPEATFDDWYAEQLDARRPMGAPSLNWPTPLQERIALQLELLRNIALDREPASHHILTFHRSGGSIDAYIADFVQQTFVPFHRDLSLVLFNSRKIADDDTPTPSQDPATNFVDPSRLAALRTLDSSTYDLKKLIRLCEELDCCYQRECFHAVAALTRALIDHVPPIFGYSNFSQVANNYQGSRSFRDSMQHLSASARKIGDAHLHTQIRSGEVLPTRTQVDFSQDVDVLLAEIVRVLS